MNKLLLVAAAGLGIAALSSPASAADGTISISGTVNAATCTVNGGGNVTVTLPTVSTTALTAAGVTAGATAFSIQLSGCTVGVARAYFEPGSTIDPASGRLNNTGSATNVQVQLLNSNLSAINLAGGSIATQGSNSIATVAGANNLNYYARYYATDAVGAGGVATSVNYTIVYQ